VGLAIIIWLVVSTPLKNISQMGLLFPIYGKNKKCLKPPTSHGPSTLTITLVISCLQIRDPKGMIGQVDHKTPNVMVLNLYVPSGKRQQKTMEKHHAIHGKTHYPW